MGEATWADVAPEDLGRAQPSPQALEEWALCVTPAGCALVVPGCRRLSSLATAKGILALWAESWNLHAAECQNWTKEMQATHGFPGLEHPLMLAVVHLKSPFHLCSNPVRFGLVGC